MRDYIRSGAMPSAGMERDLACFVETPKLSRVVRLEIYRNAYYSRLVESLEEDFKRVRKFIGQQPFENLIRAYLVNYPSKSFTLADLGSHFSDFIHPHPIRESFPYLSEVAHLEWTALESFFSINVPLCDPSVFNSLSPDEWERTRLLLDSSVQILESDWPLDVIWEKWEDEDMATWLREWEKEKGGFLVYRKAFTVHVQILTPPQFATLSLLFRGEPLGSICEKAQQILSLENEKESVSHLFGNWFQLWVTEGIIRGVSSIS